MTSIVIVGIIVFLVIFYIWSSYNQFVTMKTRIKASIQEIGNQLKRQANLIPNLVSSVKGYMKHEKKVFEDLTEARKAVVKAVSGNDVQKLIDTGTRLQSALAPIRAVFESTPELKAAGPTSKLMDELRDTADKVMYSRRTLIDLTADFNIKVVTFPSRIVAMMFSFKQEKGLKTPSEGEHIEVKEGETKAPNVEL